MGTENGEWVMRGVEREDPLCLRTPESLIDYINEVGFLPLFEGIIPRFSVEARTVAKDWWTEDPARDPWEWRGILARSKKVAYGKFFDHKAGFVSLEWLPRFVNLRRDGYDFDGWQEDGKVSERSIKIMNLFDSEEDLFSFEIKRRAGFTKDGAKNFDSVIADMMMHTFLTVADFRPRLNRQMQPYGWSIAVYAKPETLWGSDFLWQYENETPEQSRLAIQAHLRSLRSDITDTQLKRMTL